MKCVRTSRTGSFRNLSPLEIVVSRNVVSVSDTSAVNFIVGWWLLACSMNCDISSLFMVQSENISSRESLRPVHPISRGNFFAWNGFTLRKNCSLQ